MLPISKGCWALKRLSALDDIVDEDQENAGQTLVRLIRRVAHLRGLIREAELASDSERQ